MNEHQPNWGQRLPAPEHIVTHADEMQALWSVRRKTSDNRPNIVLSDLDGTLCDTYESINPETGDRHHRLDPEILAQSAEVPIIVATQRRAKHACLPELWQKGLVHPGLPIIAENGGVIVLRKPDDSVGFDRIVPAGTFQKARDWLDTAQHEALELPRGMELITKPGDTMVIARVQDELRESRPEDQQMLLEQLQSVALPSDLVIVSSGDSLCIQHESVDKGRGLHAALGWLGLDRPDIFVVGLGNGLNDAAIFSEADLSIGVSPEVGHMVDIAMNRGPKSSTTVLREMRDTRLISTPPEIMDLSGEREAIDKLDFLIANIMAERFKVTKRVGKKKALLDIASIDAKREAEQFDACAAREILFGLPKGLLGSITRVVIDEVVKLHKQERENNDE